MMSNGYRPSATMLKTEQKATSDRGTLPLSAHLVSYVPGRVRIRISPQHRTHQTMQRLEQSLQAQQYICEAQINIYSGSVVVYYDVNTTSLDTIIAVLHNAGVSISDSPVSQSLAATTVSHAVSKLNQRVGRATSNQVDLRFLFPLGLGVLAIRQLLVKGLQWDIVPWYVLAWYSFDSFIKLHATNFPISPQSESEH